MASGSNNQEINNFESMDSVLYYAAADGDISEFQQHAGVLDQILTLNGNTILHIHITAGIDENMDFVRETLEMCPELLWKANKKGETLLHMAARHGPAHLVEYLLQECKKPYQSDQELAIKATRRMLQMTSHEAKDTALHEAVRYDDFEVVDLLTKADRELPYDANTAGETPLYLAAERGNINVFEIILRNCSPPADHGPYDRTALHVAVIRNNEEMVKLLLANEGIHKSKQDKQGWMPLHFAAYFGYIEILKKLLNITDKSAAYKADIAGKTALHVAAGSGRVDIMRELIFKCPDCCELVDERGWNALHFAVESKKKKAVKYILDTPLLGNLINEKDKNGNTPFLYAVSIDTWDPVIMRHPLVDKQVFNHQNQNAADINLANNVWISELMPDCISLVVEKLKSNVPFSISPRLRMIVCKNNNINIGKGKDEGNTVRSKSKDGEVEDEGNPMSSTCKNGKGKNHSISKFYKEARRNELIAATLIATVTFTAGFTVPGGFVVEEGPDQGTAVLVKNAAFRFFVLFNTISMTFSSFCVFNNLFLGFSSAGQDTRELIKPTKVGLVLITYAMAALFGAFIFGSFAVFRNDIIVPIILCGTPVFLFLFILNLILFF